MGGGWSLNIPFGGGIGRCTFASPWVSQRLQMIGSEEIESEDQVKLVGVLINNVLSYNEYILSCLKQAGAKINSI